MKQSCEVRETYEKQIFRTRPKKKESHSRKLMDLKTKAAMSLATEGASDNFERKEKKLFGKPVVIKNYDKTSSNKLPRPLEYEGSFEMLQNDVTNNLNWVKPPLKNAMEGYQDRRLSTKTESPTKETIGLETQRTSSSSSYSSDMENSPSEAVITESQESIVAPENQRENKTGNDDSEEWGESRCTNQTFSEVLDSPSKARGDSKRNSNQYNANVSNQSESESLLKFYTLGSKVLVAMLENTKFSFVGKVKIQILLGKVQVYGYTLEPLESVEIYSPRGHSPVSLETKDKIDTGIEKVWKFLSNEGIKEKAPFFEPLFSDCKDAAAVFILEHFENNLTNFLHKFCPFRIFPRIEEKEVHSWNSIRRAEVQLQANIHLNECKRLKVNEIFLNDVLQTVSDDLSAKQMSCTLLAGGKGVGKSTLMRYMVNGLLKSTRTPVILLDLDPGQTECTPAECISINFIDKPLLGPNFTHLKLPFYQIYLGDISVMNCLSRYIEGVAQLVKVLKEYREFSRYPVIVNTMGFCKGIGWDIMVFILKTVLPSNVVQIISSKAKNNFDGVLSKEIVNQRNLSKTRIWKLSNTNGRCNHKLFTTQSYAEKQPEAIESWNMEPRHHREIVLLAYLSQIVENTNASSINEEIPYEVPFSSLSLSLIKTTVNPAHILSVMNGNIVALCGIENVMEQTSISCDNEEDPSLPKVLIQPPLGTCYGYGIVRGVDMERKMVYLNTPVPVTMTRHVNCLLGCIPLPLTLLQFNQKGPYIGGNRDDLPTSRDTRRGTFRMKRQEN